MEMEEIDVVLADDLQPGDIIKIDGQFLAVKNTEEDDDFVNVFFEEEIDTDEEYGARFAWDSKVELYSAI